MTDQERTADEDPPDEAGRLEDAPSVPSPAGLSRRETMAIAIALLGGGTVTFAWMLGSGASTSAPAHNDPPAIERAAPAASDGSVLTPRWNSANREWLSSARGGVAFELHADNKVPIWQRKAHPILVVRCQANRAEAFVFIESAARIERQDDNHTVTLGFDDEPELTERWPDSQEHDALFAPDGAAFARRVARARTLRFGYTPHNADAVVATFSVAGLASLIAHAARQCGWKQ